jgi:hypothetical protein
MKSKEELTIIAEKLFPYDPYRETLFPGQRNAFIDGFIKGYLAAFEEINSPKK